MKYKRFLVLFSIFIILLILFIVQKSLLFVYVNPTSNTEGMKYSAITVKQVSEILDEARVISKKENVNYNYIFFNPYGSGYLKNNPIPNDLDLEVGVYLGEFEYNGENGEQVSSDIMNAIESFSLAFNFGLNAYPSGIYTDESPFELLNRMTKTNKYYKDSIKDSLDYVVNGKNYIKYVRKIFHNKKYSYRVDYPYYMSSNEILLTGFPMVKMYSDNLIYNKDQKKYLREITLIPNFFIDLKYKDKVIPVEISPESFFGARLQLKRRFFATSVFANSYSTKFLKNTEILKDEDEYFFYRMLSFRRHLLETENIKGAGLDRPLKIFKRIIQTANTIKVVLGDEKYNEISEYVESYLYNPDIQLLNECVNIYGIVYSLQKSPQLLVRLNSLGKTASLYEVAEECLNKLYERGKVDKKHLDVMKNYHETKLKYLSSISDAENVYLLEDRALCDAVKDEANVAVRELVKDDGKIDKFISYFNDILIKAGYHRTFIYWLDEHTLGILSDDYTKNIKDVEKFAKDNGLTAIEYKFINAAQIPKDTIKYEVWTRYNPTEEEEAAYKNLRQTLLDDRKNYNIKRKMVLLPH